MTMSKEFAALAGAKVQGVLKTSDYLPKELLVFDNGSVLVVTHGLITRDCCVLSTDEAAPLLEQACEEAEHIADQLSRVLTGNE